MSNARLLPCPTPNPSPRESVRITDNLARRGQRTHRGAMLGGFGAWSVLLISAACLSLGCDQQAPAPSQPPEPTAAPSAEASASAAPSAEPEPAKPTPKRPYNVILIYVDSLRWDMPWNGYERDIAPNLTRFAKDAVWYSNAYSLSSYTAKSIPPSLIGGYPSELPRDGYFFTKWAPENLFVAERVQQAGHRTLAGHVHGYFNPNLKMGPAEGVDDYRMIEGHIDLQAVKSVTDERLAKLVKEQLSDPKNVALEEGKRFFAVYHFLDPHHTYERHAEHSTFGNKARDLYDGEVHWTDKWVGQALEHIDAQPWAKDTVVIITADHGEGFGEHNQFRHAYELWESLIRVPWMFRVPGLPGRKLTAARGHIDLAPTILDLMDVKADPPLRGVSLTPELFGEEAPPRPVLADLPRDDLQDRRRALIADGYKLISFGDDRSFKLFHLAEDPEEKNELSKEQPEQLEKMKALLAAESEKIPQTPVTGGVTLKGAPGGRRY